MSWVEEAKGGKIIASPHQLEIAWAAGFYDGEGSVSCGSNNGNPQTRIQLGIGQKNDGDKIAAVLERFKKAVGVGKIYRKTRKGKEINQHQYLISKEKDVHKVINKLWPFMSYKKRYQATTAMAKLSEGKAWLKAKRERKYNG
ncbi:hypothetical protein LCGC14_0653330 [marine sediment metagenome]|uniref:Homing endonuclease LAGLIDADG domain-containing protein n=1 Tax=marine sediment metagenome TaxID=412755 RepID=A0A0F9THD6_9ZZZZ